MRQGSTINILKLPTYRDTVSNSGNDHARPLELFGNVIGRSIPFTREEENESVLGARGTGPGRLGLQKRADNFKRLVVPAGRILWYRTCS